MYPCREIARDQMTTLPDRDKRTHQTSPDHSSRRDRVAPGGYEIARVDDFDMTEHGTGSEFKLESS